MIPRQQPLADEPILFGDRGASGITDENTIESFRLALRLGATGIESDLHLTADGVPVLRRSPRTSGLRRRRIAETNRDALGDAVVDLAEFYGVIGADAHLLLHVADPGAVEAALAEATRARALERLWLASHDLGALGGWRQRNEIVGLVHEAPIETIDGGPERHASELRNRRIDAVMAPRSQWNGGRTALYHRFRRQCFATEAVHERMAVMMLHIGLDAVSSPFPDRLVDARNEVARPDAPQLRDP